ncbi:MULTISPECIES: DnaB-like helicase N-terminal domain-containing protein [unclassified Streptomyces]|uniref:DnaB-like helicase N-terminal domain-containing protein n=1 Tax=unclassified Streptomyces TaxID=2593676 RepID=UPI003626F163
MPRPTDSDEDALDTTAPPPPVYYAEQALLGGLLSQPHRMADIGVAAHSFADAVHTALFAAIRALPAPALDDSTGTGAYTVLRGRPATGPAPRTGHVAWLDTVLTTAREQNSGLTAAYLHLLISACPDPRHLPAYARIVEGEHARRRLRKAAVHLMHTARDTSLPHPVPTTLAEADALASVVDDIAAAFPPHSASLPRTPVPPYEPPYDGEEAAYQERALLATGTATPSDVERMRWLTSGDFTRPLHAALWRCLTALVHHRAAVDPVTVLWKAQQHGVLDGSANPQDLLSFLSEPGVSAPYLGEQILQRSVLSTAHHVGRRVEAFTDDPSTSPYQLVAGARRALADLAAIRTRWQHATGPNPPQRPRSAPASRAGPPATATAPTARAAR